MQVKFLNQNIATADKNEAQYISKTQLHITNGATYEVYGISVYDGVTFFLIIDDLETPAFKPRCLFQVEDTTIPKDWMCNAFSVGPVQLVIGPSFIAQNLDSYNNMVDQRSFQVQQFWARAHATREHEED